VNATKTLTPAVVKALRDRARATLAALPEGGYDQGAFRLRDACNVWLREQTRRTSGGGHSATVIATITAAM
jgi:hypothetical protein